MTDHLDSKNLVPFSKRRRSTFQLPAIRKDRDEEMLEQVDPDLRPEDEGLIRRYLHYADTLLGSPEIPSLALVPGGPVQRPRGSADQLRPINISSYGKPQLESVEREESNGHESREAQAPESSETRNQEVAEEQSKSDEQNQAEPSSSLGSQGANSTAHQSAEQTSPETPSHSNTDDDDNGRAA